MAWKRACKKCYRLIKPKKYTVYCSNCRSQILKDKGIEVKCI